MCVCFIYQEVVSDQELFTSILQTLLPSPYLIRSQVETRIIGHQIPKLPSAKFDIVVSNYSDNGDLDEGSSKLVAFGLGSDEKAKELISTKTDNSIHENMSGM